MRLVTWLCFSIITWEVFVHRCLPRQGLCHIHLYQILSGVWYTVGIQHLPNREKCMGRWRTSLCSHTGYDPSRSFHLCFSFLIYRLGTEIGLSYGMGILRAEPHMWSVAGGILLLTASVREERHCPQPFPVASITMPSTGKRFVLAHGSGPRLQGCMWQWLAWWWVPTRLRTVPGKGQRVQASVFLLSLDHRASALMTYLTLIFPQRPCLYLTIFRLNFYFLLLSFFSFFPFMSMVCVRAHEHVDVNVCVCMCVQACVCSCVSVCVHTCVW